MAVADQLAARIQRIKANKDLRKTSEEATKQSIVLPILQALGWDVFEPNEVRPEYDIPGGGRVDYGLLIDQKPRILIEVKKCDEELEGHQEQLCNYAFKKGAEQAILTNGLTWWFYLPLERGDWVERKVLSVELMEQVEGLVVDRLAELLSKTGVASGASVKASKNYLQRRQKEDEIRISLPEVWGQIISEPDSLLVDLIAESVEKRCGYRPESEQVIRFLKDSQVPHQVGATDRPSASGRTRYGRRTSQKSELSAKKQSPRKFKSVRVFGKSYVLRRQWELMVILAKALHENDPRRFEKIAPTCFRGDTPIFLRAAGSESRRYHRIPSTGWAVFTHASAKHKLELARRILKAFGYTGSELTVEVE